MYIYINIYINIWLIHSYVYIYYVKCLSVKSPVSAMWGWEGGGIGDNKVIDGNLLRYKEKTEMT